MEITSAGIVLPTSRSCSHSLRPLSKQSMILAPFLISCSLIPNSKQARSFAFRIFHGAQDSVEKIACMVGANLVVVWTGTTPGTCVGGGIRLRDSRRSFCGDIDG